MPIANYKSPLGTIIITSDDGFVTAISISDEEIEVIPTHDPVMVQAMKQLEEYFAGDRKIFDFPVKQAGTDFQQKVWKQLTKIEYGKTISYGQQSKMMNKPLGIRAIASANGKNNLWIVVPCHRVVGSDGNLTGYAGGLWRKKWLLEHEAKVSGVGQTTITF